MGRGDGDCSAPAAAKRPRCDAAAGEGGGEDLPPATRAALDSVVTAVRGGLESDLRGLRRALTERAQRECDALVERAKTRCDALVERATKRETSLKRLAADRERAVEGRERALVEQLQRVEECARRQGDRVRLNVRGVRTEVSRRALTHEPGTFVCMLGSERWRPDERGEYFIDRSTVYVEPIIEYLAACADDARTRTDAELVSACIEHARRRGDQFGHGDAWKAAFHDEVLFFSVGSLQAAMQYRYQIVRQWNCGIRRGDEPAFTQMGNDGVIIESKGPSSDIYRVDCAIGVNQVADICVELIQCNEGWLHDIGLARPGFNAHMGQEWLSMTQNNAIFIPSHVGARIGPVGICEHYACHQAARRGGKDEERVAAAMRMVVDGVRSEVRWYVGMTRRRQGDDAKEFFEFTRSLNPDDFPLIPLLQTYGTGAKFHLSGEWLGTI